MTGLCRKNVVPSTVSHDRESSIRFFNPSSIRNPTSNRILRVAVWAKKSQIGRPVVSIVAVNMIKNWLERSAAPFERPRMQLTLRVVASLWQGRNLLPAPLHVLTTHNLSLSLAISVDKHILLFLSYSGFAHTMAPMECDAQRIAFICRSAQTCLTRVLYWRQINLVGLNLTESGTYGDRKVLRQVVNCMIGEYASG